MPNAFEIDVTEMQPHDVIRLADVPMPQGCHRIGRPGDADRHRPHHPAAIADADVAEAAEGAEAMRQPKLLPQSDRTPA